MSYGSEGLSSHPHHPHHPRHLHPYHPNHHYDHVDQAGGERSDGGKGVSTLPSLSLTNVYPSTKVRIDIRKILDKKMIVKNYLPNKVRRERHQKKNL